ncbi:MULTISPECIES: hypothetical protein [Cyanophyceae]|uniref:hypothetical protein n=1 Tax=Cyanophyceae TaxID=3028117 RepID=UPI00168464DC|nr:MULTISPECIES: hypothetical protein [Cyanophyceae]MBD1915551.1 hypothetical protein [Phormidium sp. FACHB-77]MBD2031861.1 hypothetical protein [Phormidium sp. FACHB-322]MBD2050611.1 hypothetical protein [Leptolyngbya sp. FACHB-60]
MTYSVKPRQAGEPKLKSLANRKLYSAIAGGLLLAIAAGATIRFTTADSRSNEVAEVTPVNDAVVPDQTADGALTPAGEAATPFQSKPFYAASAPLRLADPSLLRSTSPQARVEAISAGRSDPFASVVLPGPKVSRPSRAAAASTPAPAATPGQALPTVPASATQSLPPLPQVATQTVALPNLPAPFLPGSVPPIPTDLAVAPTGSPAFQNLVDQVVVSGVVQVGSGISVIITEPGSTVSRRVAQGDMLAGGRIKLKSVDMSGQEPMVVLTYDGRDYTRTVGAPMVSAL